MLGEGRPLRSPPRGPLTTGVYRRRGPRLNLLPEPGFCLRPMGRMSAYEGASLRLATPSLDQVVGALLGDVPMVADTVPEPRPLSLMDPLASDVHHEKNSLIRTDVLYQWRLDLNRLGAGIHGIIHGILLPNDGP
jgi:hypothetical protein